MGLRERLEAAEVERRKAAGLPTPKNAESLADVARPKIAPEPLETIELPVIDLREPAPVLDLRTRPRPRDGAAPDESRAATPNAAVAPCPSCGAPGRLDMQDTVGRVDHYSCLSCHSLFQLQR